MDQLRPPAGYRLESAVATTFTLHLATALVAPLSFASYDLRTHEDSIAVLEAVRACADRVDIFCQAGQIAVPQHASDLMAFLEPMLHPLRRPRPGRLFHPKTWVLRYTAANAPDAYRLICSTRNLVDSRAWDAAVILDGSQMKRCLDGNRPLARFLRQLPKWAVTDLAPERLERVNDLADRVERVEWSLPELVSSAHFHAMGVPRLLPDMDFSGYRHLVVSPFLNREGVRHVSGNNAQDVALVSRPEAIDALGPEFLTGLRRPNDDAVFVLDPLANLDTGSVEAETPATGGDGGGTHRHDQPANGDELVGLHAKITIAERNRGETHVFVGSANATDAAYGGNVEFVVELVGRAKDLGVKTMMAIQEDPTTANFRSLLQAYTPEPDRAMPELDEELHALENLLRSLAAVPFRMEVQPVERDYRLHLTSEAELDFPEGHVVQLALLTERGMSHTQTEPGRCDASFVTVLADITPFVVMRVTNTTNLVLSTVVHAPLQNDPPNRLDEVLARQVDTPEKFLRFLSLLLGLTDPSAIRADETNIGGAGAPWGMPAGGRTGLFELVVRALADRPDVLRDLDRLVIRLRETDRGREVLPDGFDALWDTVTEALENMEATG